MSLNTELTEGGQRSFYSTQIVNESILQAKRLTFIYSIRVFHLLITDTWES